MARHKHQADEFSAPVTPDADTTPERGPTDDPPAVKPVVSSPAVVMPADAPQDVLHGLRTAGRLWRVRDRRDPNYRALVDVGHVDGKAEEAIAVIVASKPDTKAGDLKAELLKP